MSRQANIEQAIRRVGGYWPAFAALARLSEELGEVAEELRSHQKQKLAEETADVVFISTCIANQYKADLATAYARLGLGQDFRIKRGSVDAASAYDALIGMMTAAGELARIINRYEGPKRPKIGEKLTPVGDAVALIHAYSGRLAEIENFNLEQTVDAVCEAKSRRDAGRFDMSYDPALCESLDHFRLLQQQTHCPFAKLAKVWGSPTYEANRENSWFDVTASQLTRFCRIAPHECLDGFVVVLPGSPFGSSLTNLSSTVRHVLTELNFRDPKKSDCMKGGFETTGWQFEFCTMRLFLISFAPFYSKNNSRFGFGSQHTILFFQPEQSFNVMHIPRGEEKKVRHEIRKSFAKAGKSYDGNIINAPLEAPRYVKPLSLSDPVVRWWEADISLIGKTNSEQARTE